MDDIRSVLFILSVSNVEVTSRLTTVDGQTLTKKSSWSSKGYQRTLPISKLVADKDMSSHLVLFDMKRTFL